MSTTMTPETTKEVGGQTYLSGSLPRIPRTVIELKQRDGIYQITIRSDSPSEGRQLVGSFMSLIAETTSLEMDECSVALFRACGPAPSSG